MDSKPAVATPKANATGHHGAGAKAANPIAAQQGETQLLAHKMLGHMNLAALAIHAGLSEEAPEHIAAARKLAKQLEREAPEVVSDTTLKYGKLTYSYKDDEKNYYVPIYDDVFLLSDYRETYHAFRQSDLEETEAGVVRVTVRADLRAIEDALDIASRDLAAKHPDRAAEALRGAFKGALTDETVITDPTWAIYDNLALARNLLAEHHHHAARLVLEHAKSRLAELEKIHTGTKETKEFADVREQMSALAKRLETEDPTLMESADQLFHDWMRRVRGWIGSAA